MTEPGRAILIVLDGVGIGELPDAADFDDQGSDTLGNLAKAVGGLHLPNLEKLGLGNIAPIKGIAVQPEPVACFGKLGEQSPGKDSTTGHWEIAGCILNSAFPTYPHGFPPEILDPFRKEIGRGILGNKAASGTEIIRELGIDHLNTGYPIVYTSADSVFQIAAHEDIIPRDELYRMCETARRILTGKHAVSRVIARPFVGDSPERFERTRGRRDFSLKPPRKLIQDCFRENGYKTVGIGKIDDLYAGAGLDRKIHTKSNQDGLSVLREQIKKLEKGLIMINLVDFDMLWGHRNNPSGFYEELQRFDYQIPAILDLLKPGDILIVTADHGNDPTTPSTDHSREYVPVLVYGPGLKQGINVGTRDTMADIGKTMANFFALKDCEIEGNSFRHLLTD